MSYRSMLCERKRAKWDIWKKRRLEMGRETILSSTNILIWYLKLLNQNVYKNTDAFVIVIESFKNKFVKETHEETLWN